MVRYFFVGITNFYCLVSKGRKRKVDRRGRPLYTKQSGEIAHMIAFARCINQADRLMREFHPGEVATVFAEDIDGRKRELMRDMIKKIQLSPGIFGDFTSEPIERVRNGISWVKKDDCVFLQLADAVAYSFRRYHQKIRFGDYLKWALVGRPQVKLDADRTAKQGGKFCAATCSDQAWYHLVAAKIDFPVPHLPRWGLVRQRRSFARLRRETSRSGLSSFRASSSLASGRNSCSIGKLLADDTLEQHIGIPVTGATTPIFTSPPPAPRPPCRSAAAPRTAWA